MSASFNLITEDWIPCVTHAGEYQELSLAGLFENAHELRGIEDQNPLVVAAIYRLLLAIVHRAIDGPKGRKEWRTLWRAGKFDQRFPAYLEEWEVRFDLFSEKHPFYQTAGLRTDNLTPITKLFHEKASKHNKTLFDHRFDDDVLPISPSDATRAVLVMQQSALYGGISSKSNLGSHRNFASAPLTGKVSVFLQGKSLFQSLTMNLLIFSGDVPMPRTKNDLPIWENKNLSQTTSAIRSPEGYFDYLTWQPRHIRLIPDERGYVTNVYFTQKDILKSDTLDPLAWYKPNKKPYAFNPDRVFWRDSAPLFKFFIHSNEKRLPPLNLEQFAEVYEESECSESLLLIGLASEEGGPVLWRQEYMPIPNRIQDSPLIAPSIVEWIGYVEKVFKALSDETRWFARQLLTDGTRKADAGDVTKVVSSLGTFRYYWSRMETIFYSFLRELNEDTDINDWRSKAKWVATDAFLLTTENALGRSQRELRARAMAQIRLTRAIKKIK